ncbi:unnamed protein product [Diatraea saccharalis]|uniref:CHK kinase-like domain-containing protein n=1 Tax=Diatraea saccharalis TaxID=40085 RepID=A0A9N9R9Y0_9NEOP|nr:unnamed protein product [Diatraea saccharalis]
MLLDDERLKSILADVAKKLKVDKKWRYVIKKLDEEIVNYSGNLRLISLIDKTNDKVYKLICKTPPNWAIASIVDAIVINEYHAYSTLFPIFKSLKSSVDVDNLFPECYYIDSKPDNRVLVFQDMTSKGFERRHGNNFDFNHMTVTLETIAKYHALSFILRENDISNVYANRLKSFSEKRPECLFEFIKHFVDEWLPVFKDKYYVHVLEGISKNIERNMEECVAKAKGLVYGHGDLWKENILFKYSVSIVYYHT